MCFTASASSAKDYSKLNYKYYTYVGSTVCTDCGKVLDGGKITTPVGDINVPTETISYIGSVVKSAVTNVTNKLKSAVSSLFKR